MCSEKRPVHLVNAVDAPAVADPLAVRWIRHQNTTLAVGIRIAVCKRRRDVRVPKDDTVVHARFFRVLTRCLDRLWIDIRCVDHQLAALIDRRESCLAFFFPECGRNRFPFLAHKAAADARRDIAADHRRLDRNRAGAAAGVKENAVFVPKGKQYHCRRQRLLDRCLDARLPIAALVQSRSCRVEGYGHAIFA